MIRIIVDGYNAIHGCERLYEVLDTKGLEASRTALCRRLARTRRVDGVLVAFDGDSSANLPNRTTICGLQAVFSPSRSSADDLIVELLRKHPDPHAVTVVTSDAHLIERAGALRAGDISYEDFLTANPEPGPELRLEPKEKFDGPGSAEVDYWLKEFGCGEEE